MKLREALIRQLPSLELQRAAQAEIAQLDFQVEHLKIALTNMESQMNYYRQLAREWAEKAGTSDTTSPVPPQEQTP